MRTFQFCSMRGVRVVQDQFLLNCLAVLFFCGDSWMNVLCDFRENETNGVESLG